MDMRKRAGSSAVEPFDALELAHKWRERDMERALKRGLPTRSPSELREGQQHHVLLRLPWEMKERGGDARPTVVDALTAGSAVRRWAGLVTSLPYSAQPLVLLGGRRGRRGEGREGKRREEKREEGRELIELPLLRVDPVITCTMRHAPCAMHHASCAIAMHHAPCTMRHAPSPCTPATH